MAEQVAQMNDAPFDPAREELLAQAEAALTRQLQDGDAAGASAFLRVWGSGLSTADLASRSAEDIAGAALSLWDFAQRRPRGQACVRVLDQRGRAEGWRSAYAIAEIVNDDMPFLVESALG